MPDDRRRVDGSVWRATRRAVFASTGRCATRASVCNGFASASMRASVSSSGGGSTKGCGPFESRGLDARRVQRKYLADPMDGGHARGRCRLALQKRCGINKRGSALVRDVNAGADRIAEPGDLLTRNDANDLPGDLPAELRLARYDLLHQDAATDRILAGKFPLGQRLVDERDGRCAGPVVVAQRSSRKQFDAQGVEVRRADDLEERRAAIGDGP